MNLLGKIIAARPLNEISPIGMYVVVSHTESEIRAVPTIGGLLSCRSYVVRDVNSSSPQQWDILAVFEDDECIAKVIQTLTDLFKTSVFTGTGAIYARSVRKALIDTYEYRIRERVQVAADVQEANITEKFAIVRAEVQDPPEVPEATSPPFISVYNPDAQPKQPSVHAEMTMNDGEFSYPLPNGLRVVGRDPEVVYAAGQAIVKTFG